MSESPALGPAGHTGGSGTHTTRLYYDDARLDTFWATVTALADEGRTVFLDRTAFYPTSGGQPHDTGWLADASVVDVVDDGYRIAHCLSKALMLTTGAVVSGRIDMHRRLDHMQQHTGQHLLSALLADRHGWHTVSVHFGENESTLDVATPRITPEQLAVIESSVNELARSNRGVSVSYENSRTARGLRKPSGRDGTLRVVTIDGLDRSACGCTHVASTGEIGAILLRRAEPIRDNTRVTFVCGGRAVLCAHDDLELLTRVARSLSTSAREIPLLVEQMQQHVMELERNNRRLAFQMAKHAAAEHWAAADIDHDGIRRVIITVDTPVKDTEPLAREITGRSSCAVLVTNHAAGGVLFATSADLSIDAGRQLRAALQSVGGRGGGSAHMAQGTVSDAVDRTCAVETVAGMLGF